MILRGGLKLLAKPVYIKLNIFVLHCLQYKEGIFSLFMKHYLHVDHSFYLHFISKYYLKR